MMEEVNEGIVQQERTVQGNLSGESEFGGAFRVREAPQIIGGGVRAGRGEGASLHRIKTETEETGDASAIPIDLRAQSRS